MKNEREVSFGERLRQLREAATLTQEQLAERAGLTAKGISALERGERRRPYPHTLQALRAALELSEAEYNSLVAALRSRPVSPPAETPLSPATIFPIPPTPLIGRGTDTAEVTRLVTETPVRLLTLTGPGGVGKTRLALHLMSTIAGQFADGVVFVPLASIQEAGLVIPAIAATLHLRETVNVPLRDLLQGYLYPKRLLLVLDNFEHVVDAAPEIAALLAACPLIRVLITSRAPLRVRGEQEYPVKPLALPALDHIPQVDEVKDLPAIQLFVQCAQAVAPEFTLAQANVTAIAAICRRLDGLPLAIELAAARIKLLGPTALLARLDRALPLLVGGARDLPERQQTMRRTVAWSYDLLTAQEQRLFRWLAVFAGRWTLAAAEAICQAAGEPDELLEGLMSLLDKNLIIRLEEPSEEPHFAFLETIRAFAWEQLEAAGEIEEMRRRHAVYYRTLAEAAAQEQTRGKQPAGLDRLEQAHDNLQSALDWFLLGGDVESISRIAWSLWHFWYLRGFSGEALRWMERALALPDGWSAQTRARALLVMGAALHEQGQMERATAVVEMGLHDTDEIDFRTRLFGLTLYSFILLAQGALNQAKDFLGQTLALARAKGDRTAEGTALIGLGQVAIDERNFEEAVSYLEQAEALLRAEGAFELSACLIVRAVIPQLREDYVQAAQFLRESISFSIPLRDTSTMVAALEGLAGSLLGQGEAETAARLFGAAEALRETMGAFGRTSSAFEELYSRYFNEVRAQLDEASLERAWQQGRTMPLREVVALALGETNVLSDF